MPDKPLTKEEVERNRNALRHVKTWLRYREMTQRELSEQLDMSEPAVSKWLRGLSSMSMAQFMQIAAILRCKPEDLLFPPADEGRGERYRAAAEIAENLTSAELAAWITVGKAMEKK